MPISGLVLTLADDHDDRRAALRALRACGAFELGADDDRRVPAVMETRSDDEQRRWWRWLDDLRGVHHVDVVFVSFDDDPAARSAEAEHDHDHGAAAPTRRCEPAREECTHP
ncbi:MAG: hypothetical protein KDA25_06540 [Phycisphaerales bacterium]|nr:hypothetical protein [Phycisphaerales bacterium]